MKWIFIIVLFTACTNKQGASLLVSVESSDPNLLFNNGSWFYKGKLFSGKLTERYPDQKVHHVTSFFDGKENGWQESFFNDGSISEKRFYTNGEKDGINTGWWPNGNKRFEYQFSKGIYSGDFKEWFEDGKEYKYIYYVNGNDQWGKGWRESGKLFMNYQVKDGRRYGIVNSNLCYTVKNGNGEYVASIPDSSKTN